MAFLRRFLTLIALALIQPAANAYGSQTMDSLSIYESRDSIKQLKQEGIRYARRGDFKKAKKLFLEELACKKKVHHATHPKIANTLVNLGVVHKKSGRLDEALSYYKKAERIYASNPGFNPEKIGTNLQNMANIYSLQKDYEKAETYYAHAIKLFKEDSLNNLHRLGMVYNNLGIIYKKQNKLQSSVRYYKESVRYKNKCDQETLYISQGNLANALRLMGKNEEAATYFKEVLNYGKKHFGENYYMLDNHYLNYGLLKLNQKNYNETEALLKKSLEISRTSLGEKNPETAIAQKHLGYLYALRKDYDIALTYYQKALISLSDNFTDTSIASNPGIQNIFSKPEYINILKRKAKALVNPGNGKFNNLTAALACYELALSAIKELRTGYQSQESKLLLTSNERETFLHTIETSIQLYNQTKESQYLKKAFRYAEESKAAVLYEAMQFNQALTLGDIPDSLVKKENGIKKEIWTYEELIFEEHKKRQPKEEKLDFWNKRLFELNRDYEKLVNQFEAQYPRYYSLKYEQRPLKLQTIQQKIGSGEAIVEYVLNSKRIYAFLIEKHKLDLKTIPIDSSFNDQVLKFRKSASNRNFSSITMKDFQEYNKLAYQLYETLIEPLQIPKNKRLTIIPDDILSYIPFETLVTEETSYDQICYNKLEYLIKKYKIGYSYSAKVLFNNLNTTRNPQKKLAAFAPTYYNLKKIGEFKSKTRQDYREKLYPLKGITKEADRITHIIRGDAYKDYEATETVFKSKSDDYDILHLAMHTLVNDQQPMYSKMAFTQEEEKEEDGFLNTYEIYNLNLNSRLAVLSSCNTGSGKLRKGEGVISLARGFKYAGCPSIVMTMWPVEDNSSIRLMENFYRSIDKGKSKDQALRKAKLRFIEKSDPLHAHPYFWAGYILIGDKSALYKPLYYWWGIAGIGMLLLISTFFIAKKKFYS